MSQNYKYKLIQSKNVIHRSNYVFLNYARRFNPLE